MAHDAFISYSSQDKPVADAVCAAVEAAGIRCWIAPRDVQPGRSFSGEITRAIQRSKVMVLIFSAHSNASEQVLREVQLAANAHLHIVQFRIQDVLPCDDLEYYLSAPHWLDALTPPLETHLGRLEKSLKALLEMSSSEATASETGPALMAATPTVPIPSQDKPAAPPVPAAPVPPVVAPASPFPAVAAPLTSIRSQRTQKFSPVVKRWIAAAPIVLLVTALILLWVLPRFRHPAVPTNTAVGTAKSTASSSSIAEGRGPSFAFVDMNRTFKEYSKTKQAETGINQAKKNAKEEYDTRASAYKKQIDEINDLDNKLRSSGLGSDTKARTTRQREAKISEIKKMEREINEFRVAREKQLQDDALRMRTDIVGQITAKIKELGGSKDNFIIDTSANSLNGVPFFLFTPRKADMSDRVISALNTRTADPFLTTRGGRLAVVDMNAIFKGYNKTSSAEATINEAKNSAKQEYDARADAYKSKLAALNAMSSGIRRDQAISEVKAMEREINQWKESREKELQNQALRLREGIVKEIEDFISQQYIKGEEDMVLDISAKGLNGAMLVVSWRNVPNLTNEVISGLNGSSPESATKSTYAYSDHLRFGLVNMDRALRVMPETREVEAEIDAAKEKAKSELGAYPSSAARTAKDSELQSLAAEKRTPIMKRISTNVSAIAEAKNLDVIFDSSGNSLNGVPVIVASSEVPDVTEEVVARAQNTVNR